MCVADGIDQGGVDHLGNLRNLRLDGLRRQFEIAALSKNVTHLRVVDDVDIEVSISLGHPLRSGGAECLSRSICAGTRSLDEHDWLGVLEGSNPIIEGWIRVKGIRLGKAKLGMDFVLLDELLIEVLWIILCGIALVDVLVVVKLLRVGGGLAISMAGVVLLGLGDAVTDLNLIVCDGWRTNNSVVVSCRQSRHVETHRIKWLSWGIIVIKLLIGSGS
jgi:hypothetical protein